MSWILSLLVTIPVGAGFGYLAGGVFLVLDALAQWQRSQHDAAEAAEPPESSEVVQESEDPENSSSAP
jgi:hypothetical protein